MKRPAFQWYPGDWRRDTALQSCSIDARGLWVEMLNLMHDGEPYGHLTAGGIPITAAMLATLTGVPIARVRKMLGELGERGIFSRTNDDAIYSRRMVRDEELRTRRAAGGKLGGNPALVPYKDNPEVPPEVSGKVNLQSTPATATATAVASAVDLELLATARINFCVAANRGLAEHPTHPQLVPRVLPNSAKSYEAAEVLLSCGVPADFAQQAIYEEARSHGADRPIVSLKYFVASVTRRWEESQAAAVMLESPLRPSNEPPRRQNGAPPPRPSPQGAAALVFGQIKELVRESRQPGQAMFRYIPRQQVADLGADVLQAYDAIGGADRVLSATGEQVGFVIRDFTQALEAAHATA